MATTVTLNGGIQLTSQGVHGCKVNYQNAHRDCLVFLFDPDMYDMDTIDKAFATENCGVMTLSTGEDDINQHDDYNIRISISKGLPEYPVTNTGSSLDTQPVCIIVKMAQTSFVEKTLINQQDTLDMLLISMLKGEQ